MVELSMEDFLDRVFMTTERVKFSQADPYGHLGTAEYVNLIVNHRIEALVTTAGVDLPRIAQAVGVAFPVRDLSLHLRVPSFVGTPLEIASWIAGFRSKGMTIRAVLIGAQDRNVRATCVMQCVSVDALTGRPIVLPSTLQSHLEASVLHTLPTVEEHLEGIDGLPEEWLSVPAG